ncbi:hypothetical protein [uncultured Tateyamaria sp.]|uniref:hypothetical protein n=1 Tax=uncultured Tateyamaria sp. TaxID=455651 RepID=UPI00261F36A0|nr:hypothetical protein [uncultured Tateyamaria sp.]
MRAARNGPGLGTTTPGELAFVQAANHGRGPNSIGTWHRIRPYDPCHRPTFGEGRRGSSLTTIDIGTLCFGDHGTPVGCVAANIHDGRAIDTRIAARKTALDPGTPGGAWTGPPMSQARLDRFRAHIEARHGADLADVRTETARLSRGSLPRRAGFALRYRRRQDAHCKVRRQPPLTPDA